MKKIIILLSILTCFSCNDEVTIISENPLPDQNDDVFEINLVGFATDLNRSYVAEVEVGLNGDLISTDPNGLYHFEQILIPATGGVLSARKDGYVPMYKRFYNYASLDQITTNLTMIEAPANFFVDNEGGSFSDSDLKINVEANDFTNPVSLTFFNPNNIDFDNLILTEKVEILDIQSLVFIDFDQDLSTGKSLTIETNSSANLDLYSYDTNLLTWVKQDELDVQNGIISGEIMDRGWWAFGNAISAVYGELTIHQTTDMPLIDSEVELIPLSFTKGIKSNLYTNNKGKIIKYFPIGEVQEVTLLNQSISLGTIDKFDRENAVQNFEIGNEIIQPIEAMLYDCNLDRSSGYIAILLDGNHILQEVESGVFSGNVFAAAENVTLLHYDNNFNALGAKTLNVPALLNQQPSIVTCSPQLRVRDENNEALDYGECRVKVRPNETIVIGEDEFSGGGSIFLVSFNADSEGVYMGLVYSDIQEYGTNVNPEAEIEIIVYDELTNVIAGKIKAQYLDTEDDFDAVFIGNIE